MIGLSDFGPRADEVVEHERDGLREEAGTVAALHGRRLVLACRAAATAALFLDYGPEAFRARLADAAAARAYVLAHVAPDADGVERFFKVTEPGFVDALACQDWAVARQIGAVDLPWRPDSEYEEDHLFHAFLADVVVRRDHERAASRLSEIVRAREGAPWTRLRVGRAVLDADSEAFDDAFRRLLDDWEAEVEFWRTSLGRDDVAFMTDERVFIEGLAILQVARALGIEIRDAYRFCPEEVLALPPPTEPSTLFTAASSA